MLQTLKKFFAFCGEDNRKLFVMSIWLGVVSAICSALRIPAAAIVILDEATSYTDPENEAVIQSALARLVRGKTLLVIAHRLSTIADADQIIVVNQGRIEATGTQDELLASCPLYQTMWEAHISVKDDGEVA